MILFDKRNGIIREVVDDLSDIPHRIDANGDCWKLKRDGSVSGHRPLGLFDIEKIKPTAGEPDDPKNTVLLRDVQRSLGEVDSVGDVKYSMVDNAGTWELHAKDGWEYYEDI